MDSQMISSTVSEANQTAVPALVRRLLEIKSGDRLIWRTEINESIVKVKRAPREWGKYMKGLGGNLWRDSKANKYLSDIRADRHG